MTDRHTVDTLTSDALDQLYDERDALASDLAELAQARQHGAFTYCPQLVGHVTVAEFARKISEKRAAVGQRDEAVRYANEQKQRADRAEAAIERVRGYVEHALATDGPGIGLSPGHILALLDTDPMRTTAQTAGQPEPATITDPTVAEAAAQDRRWPLEKHGE